MLVKNNSIGSAYRRLNIASPSHDIQMDLLVIEEKSIGLAFFVIFPTILDQKPNQTMTTVEGSSTDLESIISNANRPAPSGADRAVDPADAGSVLGGGGGAQPLGGGVRLASVDDRSFIGGAGSVRGQTGAGSLHSGARSIENDDQHVDNNDVRRLFRREIGRPIFDNSRPVITGKKITNQTWKKRKKMTLFFFSRTSGLGGSCHD